jgi:hypothetical protein
MSNLTIGAIVFINGGYYRFLGNNRFIPVRDE